MSSSSPLLRRIVRGLALSSAVVAATVLAPLAAHAETVPLIGADSLPSCIAIKPGKVVTTTDSSWQFVNEKISDDGTLTLSGPGQSTVALFLDEPIEPSAVQSISATFERTGQDKPFVNLQYNTVRSTHHANLRPAYVDGAWLWASPEPFANMTDYAETKGSVGTLEQWSKNTDIKIHALAIRTNSTSRATDSWSTKEIVFNCTRYSFAPASNVEASLDDLKRTSPTVSAPFATVTNTNPSVEFTLTHPRVATPVVTNGRTPVTLPASGTWSATATLSHPASSSWKGGKAPKLGSFTVTGVPLKGTIKATNVTPSGNPSHWTGKVTVEVDIPFATSMGMGILTATGPAGPHTQTKSFPADLSSGKTSFEIGAIAPGHYTATLKVPSYPELSTNTLRVFVPPVGFTGLSVAVAPDSILADTGLGHTDAAGATPATGANGEAKATFANSEVIDVDVDVTLGTKKLATITVPAKSSVSLPMAKLGAGRHTVAATISGTQDQVKASFDVADGTRLATIKAPASVAQGGSLSLSGTYEGLLPNSNLTIWLHSKPLKLGTTKVADNGGWATSVKIPASAPAGKHTVVVADAAGRVIATQSVTITKSARNPVNPTGRDDREMPRTGFDGAGVGVIALALAGAGAILLGGARLRSGSRR